MLYVGAQCQKPGDCQHEHYHGGIGVELDGDICGFRGKKDRKKSPVIFLHTKRPSLGSRDSLQVRNCSANRTS